MTLTRYLNILQKEIFEVKNYVGWNPANEKWINIQIEKLLSDYNKLINDKSNETQSTQSQEIKTDI
jgi:hypothetical protein